MFRTNSKSIAITSVFIALFFILAIGGIHSVHALSFPSGITNYVALNISNSQSTATPNPFQQMINVTSADNGWSYINNTGNHFGQNVEFFYANGTIINSWLENYTSGHALWWVKVGSIPASSTLTIYMGFASKTTNLLNNKTTGEAPQLSSTYGEYDNGANVFNYYQRWGGLTALPTGWTLGADTTATFDADYTILTFSTTTNNVQSSTYISAPITSTPITYELFGLINVPSSITNSPDGFGVISSTTTTANTFFMVGAYDFNTNNNPTFMVGNTNTSVLPPTTNAIYTSNVLNTTDMTGQINYGTTYSYTSSTAGALTYLEFDFFSGTGGTITQTIYWTRARSYPPNGVMPSVSFGSVESALTLTLYLNGVSNANTSITYGTQSNFTAIITSNTAYVSLYVNGTKVVSLTQGKAAYLKTLSAGLYKVTASTNTSGVNNVTYYERINKATPTLTATVNGKALGSYTIRASNLSLNGRKATSKYYYWMPARY